ncbi:MAG: hypothetical protein ACJAVK_003430, partial [Akkermansiaceae bacterium]
MFGNGDDELAFQRDRKCHFLEKFFSAKAAEGSAGDDGAAGPGGDQVDHKVEVFDFHRGLETWKSGIDKGTILAVWRREDL